MNILKLNHKRIRAEIIARYVQHRRTFAFSCGNSTKELKRAGVNLIPIDGNTLEASRYITPEEAQMIFGGAFNATSGCLPAYLNVRIAYAIQEKIRKEIEGKTIVVPFGSGELIACLAYFHPLNKIIAITSDRFKPTTQDGTSPLADLIETQCEVIRSNASDIPGLIGDAINDGRGEIFIDTAIE